MNHVCVCPTCDAPHEAPHYDPFLAVPEVALIGRDGLVPRDSWEAGLRMVNPRFTLVTRNNYTGRYGYV